MLTAGIDCGSRNTKAVLLKDKNIAGKGICVTGFDQKKAADLALEKAIMEARISREDMTGVAITGSGAKELNQTRLNEILVMARAAKFLCPTAGTVINVGAESSMAAKLGKGGEVMDFSLNERCAAGAGAFIEAMSHALNIPVEEIGNLSLRSKKRISINAQCVIFAESEVVGLIHANIPREDIARAIHDAMASRVATMVLRMGMDGDVVLFGGMALNPGFVDAMCRHLDIDSLFIPENPEFGLALGAALLKRATLER